MSKTFDIPFDDCYEIVFEYKDKKIILRNMLYGWNSIVKEIVSESTIYECNEVGPAEAAMKAKDFVDNLSAEDFKFKKGDIIENKKGIFNAKKILEIYENNEEYVTTTDDNQKFNFNKKYLENNYKIAWRN
ncbi:MAG: hypothetical protein ACQEQF_00090 [Bacillota bacterium]